MFISPLIDLIIYLLVLAVVVALALWLLDEIPVPAPMHRILRIVIIVLAVLAVVGLLLRAVGVPVVRADAGPQRPAGAILEVGR